MVVSFPGRIIIDHMPKTGGQALSKWLITRLGSGCVSPDLLGGHHELIRTYGGHHSIISGHMHFFAGENLDPRYQYITCLREPVDRVLSWLFFVLYDAIPDERSKPNKEAAEIFLKSEGRECPNDFISEYSNFYVHHFSSIGGRRAGAGNAKSISQEDRLAAALAAIRQYDVVGIYEDFRGFTAEVASLIGLDAPANIPKFNVSTQRPPVDKISPALRQRIMDLNQNDARLYSEVIKWKKEGAPPPPAPKSFSGWLKAARQKRKAPTAPAPSALNHGIEWQKYSPEETLLTAPFGVMTVKSPVSPMTVNQQKILHILITNQGFQKWASSTQFPLYASYHWLLSSGETYGHPSVRTPVPVKLLRAGESVAVDMTVVAPGRPGLYTLVATLIQDQFTWLERRGFTPAIITVVVKNPEAPA
jgi:Sulfotransferase family